MDITWSKYVQGTKTLYYTRRLRFHDRFMERYKPLFALEENRKLNILEIGCGPGALAGALHRWYPGADITGVDRDTEFVRFAAEHEQGVEFVEGDATALPFADGTFDVTISNTVSEHIEPGAFYGEQMRVLKPGGVCLVLSSRKGIHHTADCVKKKSEYEKKFWEKFARYDDSDRRYGVCQYPMSEAELPAAMETYGFAAVSAGYALIDLTPDDPGTPAEIARDMINANRYSDIEGISSVLETLPEHFAPEEVEEMKRLVNEKYDCRLAQYGRGEKQWDTNVSVTMVVRGVKPLL